MIAALIVLVLAGTTSAAHWGRARQECIDSASTVNLIRRRWRARTRPGWGPPRPTDRGVPQQNAVQKNRD